jgi:hypothetical protein
MSRGYTYGGGQPRTMRWVSSTEVCKYCDNTVSLRYQTNSVTRGEQFADLYAALRKHDWLAVIQYPNRTIATLCPICKAADHD